MSEHKPIFVRSLADGQLGGGTVNEVQRFANKIHRTGGPWSNTIHKLLEHLKNKGFHEAPQSFGVNKEGKEVLSYIEGEVAQRPWPDVLIQDKGLLAMIDLLKR